MRGTTISATSNGFLDFNKVKGAAFQLSNRRLFYCFVLSVTVILFFVFDFTALGTLEERKTNPNCAPLGCISRKLGPRFLNGQEIHANLSHDFAGEFTQPFIQATKEELPKGLVVPESFSDFLSDMRTNKHNMKTFAFKLKAMLEQMEENAKSAKLQEYLYRHFASNGVPKGIHCLSLNLADGYSSNAHARIQLPSPELVPRLMDNSYYHFVVASDNILAASVVVNSTVNNSAKPNKIVFHIITDRKTYSAMHAWFAFHPFKPATIEVKSLNQFDWLKRENIPILEAMETHSGFQRYYHGDHALGADFNDAPNVWAAKLQAQNPKYVSVMNHLRIYLPELFPSLQKIVFLDDDVVVQGDLSPLWDIDLQGKVNGAVETCRSSDPALKSRTFRNYLNFSQPLIASNFDPNQCAWAYGMNIFDLRVWRRTNIKEVYRYWINENLKSKMNLWRLGTLPPALIAFNGHVQPIDETWHVLGLGYQPNCNLDLIKKAAVIHYNGQAKPWLDIGFPHLRSLWTRYVDYTDEFIKNCDIIEP